MTDHHGPFHVTAGQRFAEAGNALIEGIQEIQRKVSGASGVIGELKLDALRGHVRHMQKERAEIAAICEKLVGEYKLMIVDMDQE